jgi:hypothetical protein
MDQHVVRQIERQAGRWWEGRKSKHHSNYYWSIVYNNLHIYILNISTEANFHALNCHIHFKFQSDHSNNHNLKLTHSLNNCSRKSTCSQQPLTELHSKSYKSSLYSHIFAIDAGWVMLSCTRTYRISRRSLPLSASTIPTVFTYPIRTTWTG